MDFLLTAKGELNDVLPVPQQHVVFGETKSYFEFLEKLDEQLSAQWLRKCNVMRQRYHGSSMSGNDCRKLLQSAQLLSNLLPKRHQ